MKIASGLPVRPFLQNYLNAGSTWRQRIVNYGREGIPAAPNTLRYRVDDLTNVAEMLPWTSVVTPAATQVLTIPSSVNQMGWPYRDYQLCQLTVERTYSAAGDDPAYTELELFYYTLCAVYMPGANLPNLGP